MLIEFEDIIEVVLKHEGGYVNDPKDPGGETNFGIAKALFGSAACNVAIAVSAEDLVTVDSTLTLTGSS